MIKIHTIYKAESSNSNKLKITKKKVLTLVLTVSQIYMECKGAETDFGENHGPEGYHLSLWSDGAQQR